MDKKAVPIQPAATDSQKKSVVRGKNGGKRENAGRKPSTFTVLTMKERRELFHKLLTEQGDFDEICLNLFTRAKTDPKVAAYIIDQAIGKAIQGVEIGGVNGGPIDFRNKTDDELRRLATISAAGASGVGAEGTSEETPA
jgi:hypothetical protein